MIVPTYAASVAFLGKVPTGEPGLLQLIAGLGLVSQGKGAEIAGLSRAAFIDALSASGVSPVQETLEEIREALARG